jgi:hypothetical protein
VLARVGRVLVVAVAEAFFLGGMLLLWVGGS